MSAQAAPQRPEFSAAALLEGTLERALLTAGPLAPVAQHAIRGGRRIRAMLLLHAADSRDGRALDAAAGLEMLHAATLLQDDMLDKGTVRHGRPCTYRAHGAARALLASDWLLNQALAGAYMLDARHGRKMSEAIRAMIVAESGDLAPQPGPRPVLAVQRSAALMPVPAEALTAYLLQVARGKTGGLFGLALHAAALLRNLRPAQIEEAYSLGVELGATFQLADDMIDLYAPQEQTGKDAQRDAAAGHLTLPLLYAAEALRATTPDSQKWPDVVHVPTNAPEAAAVLQQWMCQMNETQHCALHATADSQAVRGRLMQLLRSRLAEHRRIAASLAMAAAVEDCTTHLLAALPQMGAAACDC